MTTPGDHPNPKPMNISTLQTHIQAPKQDLYGHPIYGALRTLGDVRTFMEHHVYAVWDFMSLLKSLQHTLAGTQTPWLPSDHPELVRFVNEIVLGEESDEDAEGKVRSHFTMYVEAMEEIGANTAPIKAFIADLRAGANVADRIEAEAIDPRIKEFVRYNFRLIERGQAHEIAAGFTFGREDLIPELFIRILDGPHFASLELPKLRYYFERHIEVDGDHHGPLSLKMVAELCGEKEEKWQAATEVARESIRQRIRFWDATYAQLKVPVA